MPKNNATKDFRADMVKQKNGRAMQEKDVKFTDKKGKQRVRQGCSPIREGVVNIKPDTTMEDLLRYAERVHDIEAFCSTCR